MIYIIHSISDVVNGKNITILNVIWYNYSYICMNKYLYKKNHISHNFSKIIIDTMLKFSA